MRPPWGSHTRPQTDPGQRVEGAHCSAGTSCVGAGKQEGDPTGPGSSGRSRSAEKQRKCPGGGEAWQLVDYMWTKAEACL